MYHFARNFKKLLAAVEQAKIGICSTLANWTLDAVLGSSTSYPVNVPRNPLSLQSEWAPIQLDATKLRDIFVDRIWRQKLLPAIKTTLQRADGELGGKPISIVLLSGGSSNFGWLSRLIKRDLSLELGNSEILELSENFQEIVARGLAVECARRYHTDGGGDFRAITYNRLCLALRPNDSDLEIKAYRPVSTQLPHTHADPGVLIPSSSSLRGLIDEPLRWKVKLTKAPTQWLDYYFMRSSFDPLDSKNLQNVVDHRATTPAKTSFGQAIEIELTVKEDGTATPKFVYGHGSQGFQKTVEGRPFYLDMTYAAEESSGDSYLGFDFGSATSAYSYVSNNDIKVYSARSQQRTWLELSDLVSVLPHTAALPLATFLSETSLEGMAKWGREATEALLTIAAYVSLLDYSATTAAKLTKHFRGFQHRPAGPLWGMIKNAYLSRSDDMPPFCDFRSLLKDQSRVELDNSIRMISQAKHGKSTDELDYPRLIATIGNQIHGALSGKFFGFFENVKQQPFSDDTFEGIFRIAHGPSRQFIRVLKYEGPHSFSSENAYICDPSSGRALCLRPLIYWGGGWSTYGNRYLVDFLMFDSWRDDFKTASFRRVDEAEEVKLEKDSGLAKIFDTLTKLRDSDQLARLLAGLKLSEPEQER